ncbi:MAG: AAA family ATPase, partial [Gammaproteobacteria bacterium]|nr:AAA family ATPase [Gammaproteobacteria bacterium]
MATGALTDHRASRPGSERRQPTVLFCDLVDYTGLMRRLDPEDLSRVMNAYERACGEVIERYHGHLYTFEGDGFRVLFGYPEAHEDDAERAVRAALEMVEAVAAIPPEQAPGGPLAVRIGIATGLVVVETPRNDGGHIGERGEQVRPAGAVAARGEAPTLASRLQAIAEPGWVVVSQSTRARLGALFALDDLGDVTLKGYPEPVPAWRVRATLDAETRFAAMRGARAGAMIGRERELARLLELWQRARQGAGCAVLVRGEAGIGKSRLVERLAELVRPERHYRLRYQCSPFHANSALHPFSSQLARIAGEGEPAERLARLEQGLVVPREQREVVITLVAELLSIPGRAGAETLSPEKRKERFLWMLWQQMVWLAEQRPVLILFEDAHWLDPTSRELIESAIGRLGGHRVLLVITHRPGFALADAAAAAVEHVDVDTLDREQSVALALSYASPIPIADVLVERIADQAGGVPLFLEELTSWVLAALTGREHADDGTTNRLARTMSVPATLQDSLMARLDQLGPAKQVAQLGAVVGREFSREILAALWPEEPARLDDGLARLEAAQVLVRRGDGDAPRYAFRHALIHEQAYECLLRSRRVELHARLVELIETRFPDLVERDTEVVARHCEQAGLAEQAVRYWSLAAAKAMHRSASREAVNHICNALGVLERVDDAALRARFELDLHIELGAAYQAVRGFASSQAMQAFERARELCAGSDEVEKLIDIQRGL